MPLDWDYILGLCILRFEYSLGPALLRVLTPARQCIIVRLTPLAARAGLVI